MRSRSLVAVGIALAVAALPACSLIDGRSAPASSSQSKASRSASAPSAKPAASKSSRSAQPSRTVEAATPEESATEELVPLTVDVKDPQWIESAGDRICRTAPEDLPEVVGDPSPSEDTLLVQWSLDAIGVGPGVNDGLYAESTQQAIEDFQRGHGLSSDGKVKAATWAAIATEFCGSD